VARACRYDPDLNPTYREFARHYQVAIVPARVARPRDKAKVEAGVLLVERWILARLRHRQFFSLAELNAAIAELLTDLNRRAFKKLPGSRASQFAAIDQPALRGLPAMAYQYAEWSRARVHIDYHIEVESHYYSVPYPLLRERLHVRLTASTVEAFAKGERVAAHARSYVKFGYTTLDEHRPPAHRKHAEWTPSRIVAWAEKTGPCTGALVAAILAAKTFPEHGYRACLGILRLGKRCGDDRLEAASRRALKYKTCSYKSVRAILAAKLDQVVEEPAVEQTTLPFHGNIRGGEYYKH
jgi:transposase